MAVAYEVNGLMTISGFAVQIDFSRWTIRDLIRKLKITPKVMPHNKTALGLDADDRRRICEALGIEDPTAKA